MNGVVGHGQEPEEEVSGYGQHQPAPGRRERHFYSTLPVEIVYELTVCPPAMWCCPLLQAYPRTDGCKHSVFVPVLRMGIGA